MKEQYKDSNLNYYIKVRLTEDGKKAYQEYYADNIYGAPGLQIDDEGYVKFQIHDFMHIFGKRLFMGATLPCETNCKIQVKDDWHFVKDGDLPKTKKRVLVLLKDVEEPILDYYRQDGLWNYALENEVIAWKEIVPPKYWDLSTGENNINKEKE